MPPETIINSRNQMIQSHHLRFPVGCRIWHVTGAFGIVMEHVQSSLFPVSIILDNNPDEIFGSNDSYISIKQTILGNIFN